jgi:zinc and cadmium transporter
VSFISLLGIFFTSNKWDLQKLTFYFMSLASGTMLGTTFLHLLPEGLEKNPQNALSLTCAGVFIFFIMEKFFIWRHCHLHDHHDNYTHKTAATMVIVGDSIHNFIDGIIIASAFLADTRIGLTVTAAIILHEIPQELGDFGILINGGFSVKKALLVNMFCGTGALVGALLAYFFLEAAPILQATFLPLTAGGFLYIALADLIPQLHNNVTLRQTIEQIILLSLGILLLLALNHTHG